MSSLQTKIKWLKHFGQGGTRLANRSLSRIALRVSNGREPTEAQILAKCELLKASAVRIALASEMENEIRRAFDRGKEVCMVLTIYYTRYSDTRSNMQRIVVWGMKCVSYDYEFENNLVTEWEGLSDLTISQRESNRQRTRKGSMYNWDGSDEDSVSVIFSSGEDEDDLYG